APDRRRGAARQEAARGRRETVGGAPSHGPVDGLKVNRLEVLHGMWRARECHRQVLSGLRDAYRGAGRRESLNGAGSDGTTETHDDLRTRRESMRVFRPNRAAV